MKNNFRNRVRATLIKRDMITSDEPSESDKTPYGIICSDYCVSGQQLHTILDAFMKGKEKRVEIAN